MCLPVKDRNGGTADRAEGEGEGELSLSSGLQDLEVSVGVFLFLLHFFRFLPRWLPRRCKLATDEGVRTRTRCQACVITQFTLSPCT